MDLFEFYWKVIEQVQSGKDPPGRAPVVVIDDEGQEHDIKNVRSEGGLVLIETKLTEPAVTKARSTAHA